MSKKSKLGLFLLFGISLFFAGAYVQKSGLFQNKEETKDSSSAGKASTTPQEKKKPSFFKFPFERPEENFDITFSKKIGVRLSDVKGIDEVKEEIEELIKMMKFPQKYTEAGAKLHKGILLCGKPGTGKTLIARAIAGEAGINFIYMNGSDFDEVFVGVGAARIRKLFETARKHKPCMIFIDEIDSLLAKSRREGMEHSSSRATINQFLAELDGFSRVDEVFILGATNHERDLDSAAVRPGRFDKTIHINVPDEEGRKEIIRYYLDKIALKKENVDLTFIAKLTPGFTGAEIENLINLATISAVSSNLDYVNHDHFVEARDRVLMGIKRPKMNTPNKRRYKTALHEAGHTLVCYKDDVCRKNLEKVTIVSRGMAEGVTFRLYDENMLGSKKEFITDIDVAMGGHVAEELIYGPNNVSAGCSSDLDKATRVAQNMIKKFGMYGDKVGYVFVQDEGYSWEEDKTSDKYKTAIDESVNKILKESHDRVYDLLKDNANDLKNLAQKVFEYDTLNYDEICAVLEGKPELIVKKVVRESYDEKEEERKEKEKRDNAAKNENEHSV